MSVVCRSRLRSILDPICRRGGLGVLLLALLLPIACAPTMEPLETVERPSNLHELDLGVRQQFMRLWQEPGSDSPPLPEVRRNWGLLGQWFQVYRFHDSAARCYRNAIRTDSSNPRWPYFLGVLIAETGEPEVARAYFEAALALAPESVPAQVRLGDLARQMGDLARAEQRYRDVLAVRPEDPAARFGMAQLALHQGDAEAALDLLLPLAGEQPNASELHYALGTAWRLAGDQARAAAALSQVPAANADQVTLRKDDPWMAELSATDHGSRLLTRKGIKAANSGLTGRAAEIFGAAIRLDPEGAEERINYALALSRLGHYHQALEQLRQAVQLAMPGTEVHARARLEEARLLALSGRSRKAEQRLRDLLADRPDHNPARIELSRLLHTRGALDLALAEYTALRESGANGAELAFWHAAALLGLGRLDIARTQLEADIALYPDDQRLRLLWIRALLGSTASASPGEASEALQRFDRVGAPTSVLRAETIAMVYASNADYDRAIRWQQAAVDALVDAGRKMSLQIARRRSILYREHKAVTAPWEATERPVDVEVTDPYASTPR